MLLPRSEDGDHCPSGSTTCTPSSAISVSSTPEGSGPNDDDYDPDYHNRGPQRYIGIVMVGVMVLVILAYWLVWLRRKQRRKLQGIEDLDPFAAVKPTMPSSSSKPTRSCFRFGRRRAASSRTLTSPAPALACSNSADPEKAAKLQELSLPQEAALRPPKSPEPPRAISEMEKNRRRMLEASIPRGKVVKEVSGGMVIYTTTRERLRGASTADSSPSVPDPALRPPRRSSRTMEREPPRGRRRTPVRGRSVDLNAEWHMEHVHGVRYEARTPPERQRSST